MNRTVTVIDIDIVVNYYFEPQSLRTDITYEAAVQTHNLCDNFWKVTVPY
jgi:hypothetical protein